MTDKPTTIFFLGTECALDPDRPLYSGHPSSHSELHVWLREPGPTAYSAEVKQSGDRSNHWYAQAQGATLGECEKELRKEIFHAERSLESLCRKLQPTDPLIQACDDFLDRWRHIPPLVRASYGFFLVERTMKEFPVLLAEKELADLLPRRDRVNNFFRQASSALRMLAVALTRQADNEAEARGIDADVRGSIERPSVREITDALHDKNVLPTAESPSCSVCGESDPRRRDGRCQNVPASSHTWTT